MLTSCSKNNNIEKYKLYISITGEGSVNKEPYKDNYLKNEKVKLIAQGREGWGFISWKGDISGNENPKKITINNIMRISAIFEKVNTVRGKVNIINNSIDSDLNKVSTKIVNTYTMEQEQKINNRLDINKSYKNDEIIVKYNSTVSNQSLNTVENKNNMNKKSSINTKSGKMNLYKISENQKVKDKIKELNKQSDVEWAEPNYIYYKQAIPNDPDFKKQWSHQNVNMEAAWDIETGFDSVKVAVVDTGVIPDHPDLKDNLLTGADFVDEPANYDSDSIQSPKDYVMTDDDAIDEITYDNGGSHGTHVIGIIGAAGNNETGIVGVNWNIDILPVRVLGANGSGTNWDIAEGVYYAIDQGADIINLSLGRSGDQNESELEKNYIKEANSNNVLIFAASGNGGDDAIGDDSVNYPAKYDGTIAVGAVNKDNELANYSNFGPALDIVAPGGEAPNYIYSTWGYYNNDTYSGYSEMVGTSMATPYVSGIAALLISNGVRKSEVKDRLFNTTVNVSRDANKYGHGLVDAYGALLGKRLSKPVVFAGREKDNNIYVKSKLTEIDDNNIYEIKTKNEGEFYIYAWRDVNNNDKVDSGDYFGRTKETIYLNDYSIEENVNIDMYYINNTYDSMSLVI